MAISPIGVSFRNNYNISFEGRKENKNHSNSISHKLAIPAAALILSMYPSNTISAQGKFDTEKVTELYKKTNKFEILHSRVLENWAKYAENEPVPYMTVHFISDDGNEDNIEGIILEKSISKYEPNRKLFLKVKQFRISKDKFNNETKYTAVGDATSFNKSGMRQSSDVKVEISKNSFEYLTQFIQSDVNNNAVFKYVIVDD